MRNNKYLLSTEKATGGPPVAMDVIMIRGGSMGATVRINGDDLLLHSVFRPLAI